MTNEYDARLLGSYVSMYMGRYRSYDPDAYRCAARDLGAHLRPFLPADRSVRCLDIGCGHGVLLYLLKSLGCREVRGIDASEEQVSLVRKVHDAVEVADALAFLEDKKEAFGLITAIDVLEHLSSDRALRLLDLCFAALEPGGRIILQTVNAGSPFFGSLRYGDLTHCTAFTPRSLESALRLAGFVDFTSREAGPVVHGLASGVRWVLWRGVRAALTAYLLIEQGSRGDGIFTQSFVASAVKRAP